MRTSLTRIVVAAFLCLASRGLAAPATQPVDAAGKTIIEVDKPVEQFERGSLGTGGYRATEKEKPFLKQTPEKGNATASIIEETPYDLKEHKGKRVAWFGIVRAIKKTDNGYDLMLEHKHFDGLTDLHILA